MEKRTKLIPNNLRNIEEHKIKIDLEIKMKELNVA